MIEGPKKSSEIKLAGNYTAQDGNSATIKALGANNYQVDYSIPNGNASGKFMTNWQKNVNGYQSDTKMTKSDGSIFSINVKYQNVKNITITMSDGIDSHEMVFTLNSNSDSHVNSTSDNSHEKKQSEGTKYKQILTGDLTSFQGQYSDDSMEASIAQSGFTQNGYKPEDYFKNATTVFPTISYDEYGQDWIYWAGAVHATFKVDKNTKPQKVNGYYRVSFVPDSPIAVRGMDMYLVPPMVKGPGVVKRALEKVRGESFDVVAEIVKKTAFKTTRMGQMVGQVASKRLGVPFGIVDLSLAPTPAVGDSVALILEEMGLESVGTHGTTAALALLNDAVKKGGVMACNHVGGLSGAFIPVSEDAGMIKAVENGYLNIEKLEAMTAICSVGLDMIAIPGDTPAETIAAMIADEAAIGMINHKTTAVRVIPAKDAVIGDVIEFGGLLGHAPVMKVNTAKLFDFIQRGGRIPAPIHSFKN